MKNLTKPKINKKRIWELDFLRGICLILMVFDHFMINTYSLFAPFWAETLGTNSAVKFYEFTRSYLNGNLSSIRNTIRPVVLWFFFSLCGISSSFSRNNFKRGMQVALVGLLLSVGSYFVDGYFIHFGVLQMLAFCILAWAFIKKICPDVYGGAALAVCLSVMLYCFYRALPYAPIQNPDTWYWCIITDNVTHYGYTFSPGDYFAILPNACMFLAGAGLSPILYPKKKTLLPFMEGKWSSPIEWIGRNTLIIFLVHIPLITLIQALITAIMTGGFEFLKIIF